MGCTFFGENLAVHLLILCFVFASQMALLFHQNRVKDQTVPINSDMQGTYILLKKFLTERYTQQYQ